MTLVAAVNSPGESNSDDRLVRAEQGLVVSVSQAASETGRDILAQGGTAVDAAVATALVLAVTYPEAGNIGGGGFMLVYPADGRPVECIDYRETAPRGATAEMFVGETNRLGHKVVGVPGTIRGLALAHARFGKLPWKDLVAPAARLAGEGFAIDAAVAKSVESVLAEEGDFAELRRVYGKPDHTPWQTGDRFVQPELAQTLRTLADEGPEAFYRGPIAEQIVAEMQAGGGLLTAEDLAGYMAKSRPAVHGTFRGYDVYGPPLPSSGGIVLVEMLNMLETFDLARLGRWSPAAHHLTIEVMRRAYRDRAAYLGDSDFVSIPSRLTEKAYARKLAAGIDPARATASADLAGEVPLAGERPHTTHFSVIDRHGMAVANTYTLEYEFGAHVVVRGAGFLLNNQMSDFNWHPGSTDRHGAIGTPANVIAPGKRMLSSQSPTVVARDGRAVLVTGSPGGRTIINTVLSVILGVLEYGLPLDEAVAAPRMHQAWFPDKVEMEKSDDPHFAELKAGLEHLGHRVELRKQPLGDAHSILVRDGAYWGAPDRRVSGYAAGY
ncbi:MAG TPA: gamma-glutamyltransferase [Pirellulales bacterium]|nr:gamma-glutamyltransferase [Pirellulales bacterium]